MTRKGWNTLVEARRELVAHGYTIEFTPDNPIKWTCMHDRSKPSLTVQIIDRPRAGPTFEIVEYPETPWNQTPYSSPSVNSSLENATSSMLETSNVEYGTGKLSTAPEQNSEMSSLTPSSIMTPTTDSEQPNQSGD
jgi:hypothetical protein